MYGIAPVGGPVSAAMILPDYIQQRTMDFVKQADAVILLNEKNQRK